jgi:hypothetical protein
MQQHACSRLKKTITPLLVEYTLCVTAWYCNRTVLHVNLTRIREDSTRMCDQYL